jgi:hypothetical protein
LSCRKFSLTLSYSFPKTWGALCFVLTLNSVLEEDSDNIYRDNGRNVEIKKCSYQVQEGVTVLNDDLILITQPSLYKLTNF